jgi:hypothetical protein
MGDSEMGPDEAKPPPPAPATDFASALSLSNPRGLPNLIAWAVLVLALGSALHSCTVMPQARRKAAQPVIDALAAYRAERGVYPDKLDELVPKYLAKLPAEFGDDLPRPGVIDYRRHRGSARHPESYGMVFFVFMLTRCSYDPETRSWRTWD